MSEARADPEARREAAMMTANRTYDVDGMTCEHCVHAVTGEVARVPGVADVSVDLTAGTVAVSGQGVDEAAVRAAIQEAGYTVVG